jgi:hypothetical protein
MSRRIHLWFSAFLMGALAGCAGRAPLKPVEHVDERTGMSVAALQEPIQLVEDQMLVIGRRLSFVFLGPVEWNRMGAIRYGLWLHVAPGDDRPFADIHGRSAVTLILDDGDLVLSPIEAPSLGREPYQPAVSWGQTAYYELNAHNLRRLAASSHLAVRCGAADGSSILFQAPHDTRAVLGAYLQSREPIGD